MRTKPSMSLFLPLALLLSACGGSDSSPPAPPEGPPGTPPAAAEMPISLPAAPSIDAVQSAAMEKIRESLPPQMQQVLDMKNTAEQLVAILEEPCIGETGETNRIYSIEMASPQVKSVQSYADTQSADVPFQQSFQKISGIIGSGNGQFSQNEARQICDELNGMIAEAQTMIDEAAANAEGFSGPGAAPGPAPGGPRPGGPGPPGPRPPGR